MVGQEATCDQSTSEVTSRFRCSTQLKVITPGSTTTATVPL
jgi:hypothetical protein